ncbi:MAG: methionyl-tRNA formyltransferase [Marinicaulis sp.]|nr:methionyl-tRNA formyltransferase [Marinicaulis sp.]
MRITFMGTPAFSVPVLSELLAAGHEVVAVYTRAPKQSGRGHRVNKTPVHTFAEEYGIEVRTPKNFKAEDERKAFQLLSADVAVVIAYGLILPQAILDAPRHGCLNLHASLLPRWRGAAPIHRAIMAGDEQTGVQVMQMEAGLDTGPILLSESAEISPQDTAGSMHERLSYIAAQLAPRALAALERGALSPTPQPQEGVTYAEKITSSEAKIDWARTARDVDCHIRGLSPFPGAWAQHGDDRIKVLTSREYDVSGAPGEILQADERLVVACGGGAVELLALQRPGKKQQDAATFLRGYPMQTGEIF